MSRKILSNKIRCNFCQDTIKSKHRHDFVFCSCGAVAVDGGKDYLRRVFNENPETDYTELSEFEDE